MEVDRRRRENVFLADLWPPLLYTVGNTRHWSLFLVAGKRVL